MSKGLFAFTDDNFDVEALGFHIPVLVHFWAPWCRESSGIRSIMSVLRSEHGENIRIGELNTEENPQVTGDLMISSLPTVILLSGGREQQRFMGLSKLVFDHALKSTD